MHIYSIRCAHIFYIDSGLMLTAALQKADNVIQETEILLINVLVPYE